MLTPGTLPWWHGSCCQEKLISMKLISNTNEQTLVPTNNQIMLMDVNATQYAIATPTSHPQLNRINFSDINFLKNHHVCQTVLTNPSINNPVINVTEINPVNFHLHLLASKMLLYPTYPFIKLHLSCSDTPQPWPPLLILMSLKLITVNLHLHQHIHPTQLPASHVGILKINFIEIQ